MQHGVAVFSWSTGEGGLSVYLDKRGPVLGGSAVRFSDAISLGPPAVPTPLVAAEVPCSELQLRKLEIWAAMANLEARRASRSALGAKERSSLAADHSRLQEKYGVSLENLDQIGAEGQREQWGTNRKCQVREPSSGEHPLLLGPEPVPDMPPRPPHVCPRGQVWVVGVVTAEGTFKDPQSNSGSGFAGHDPKARSEAIRTLEGSVWLPALVCGRPVGVWHSVGVDILSPCSQREVEAGEILRVGGDVLPPRVLTRVAPDHRALRDSRRGGQRATFVELVVSRNGEVIQARIDNPHYAEADAAIIEAVKQWRFQPASRRGKPVSVYFNLILPLADYQGEETERQ